MIRKIGWLGERFCLLCAVGFCGIILTQSLQRSLSIWGMVVAAGAVCALAAVWLGMRYWPFDTRGTDVSIFLLRFGVAMAVILLIGGEPIQDFNTMYTAAQDLAAGGRSYLDNVYFQKWAYQTGFVVYESVLLRVFGPGQLSLQVMNALWLGGIGVLVHRIALRLFSPRTAGVTALLYALYPAPYFLAAVLTNQHMGAFFFYLALWLLVRRDEICVRDWLAAGAAMAVGNVVRPLGPVVLLAVGCWVVFRLLLRGMAGWKTHLAGLGGMLVSYGLVIALVTGGLVWSGINPNGLDNNLPTWKFVVGLNHDSRGLWNRPDYEAFQLQPESFEQAEQLMQQALRERLSVGPVQLGELALRKSGVMWGDTEDMYWCLGHLDPHSRIGPLRVERLGQILAYGDKGVYMACFALALVSLVLLLRRGTRQGGGSLMLAFLVCGYYAVHLIVEVQSRYRYFIIPAVVLLSGWCLEELRDRCKEQV